MEGIYFICRVLSKELLTVLILLYLKLEKVINKVLLESGFIFIRESKKEGEGDCSMQGGGGKERVLI